MGKERRRVVRHSEQLMVSLILMIATSGCTLARTDVVPPQCDLNTEEAIECRPEKDL